MRERLDPSTPDAALVRAIQGAGSESAFELLYDRHTPRVLQTAWRLLGGNEPDAEDAVQEAWMRAIASLDSWRSDGPFGAWLRSIVAHVAVDALRKSRRFVEESSDDLGVDDDYPGDRLDLEAAIASLAPGYRAVLVLHDIEGFTHEEIGERLGINAGTSKGQLFKARRALRARLAGSFEGRT
jgi:RNA polymerase sigma factor (sigma-70 family)